MVIPLLAATIYASDRVLLTLLKRKADTTLSELKYNYFENSSSTINNTSLGRHIAEGSLLGSAGKRFAHHDNLRDYTVKGTGTSTIWIFGDSWGEGVKKENIRNNTIANQLSGDFKKIRFIAESSWSPLLFTIAYKDRVGRYRENPDIAVFFIDQTDIGDDYCRYRPYVVRDSSGKVYGVLRSEFHEFRGAPRWRLHLALAQHSSGIKLALQRFLHVLYYLFVPGINFLSDCQYDELMAWQLGIDSSPSGSPTNDYPSYFQVSLGELDQAVSSASTSTKIIFITHDWAQHDLAFSDKRSFVNNIRSIVYEYSLTRKDKITHLHVKTSDYGEQEAANIYRYPSDRFSHLKNYSLLSRKIASALVSVIQSGRTQKATMPIN